MQKRFEIWGAGLIIAVMLSGCGSLNGRDLISSQIITESLIDEVAAIDKDFTLDNMCFNINGNTYTIGINTLKEMIDSGCNISENIGTIKAGESAEYTVVLNDTWTVTVTVKNSTDTDTSAEDCIIIGINAPIYQTEPSDLILFAFKKDMSVSNMITSLGGADEVRRDESDTEYKSTVYTYKNRNGNINSEYIFEFTADELSNVEMKITGDEIGRMNESADSNFSYDN